MVPRAPAPADENPDSTPIGNARHGSQPELFNAKCGLRMRGTKVMLDENASNKPRMITTAELLVGFARTRSAKIPRTRPGTAPITSNRKYRECTWRLAR